MAAPVAAYGAAARTFHWLTVVLVLTTIPVAIAMGRVGRGELQNFLYATHKALGLIILLVVVLRLIWRFTHPPPPLPASLPLWQRVAAAFNHWALYVLLLVMAISGYVFTVTGNFPVEVLNWMGIPPLLPVDRDVAGVFQTIHHIAKLFLFALIIVHVAAALQHLLIRRDGVFQRMWRF